MNLKELESFLKIYHTKSIARASRELFITPQGLSKLLKKLEDELCVPLFMRTQDGFVPTDFGEVFKVRAENILLQIKKVNEEFNLLKSKNLASVKLVLSFSLLEFFTPEMIFDFSLSHKNINLDYVEAPDDQVLSMVSNNTADVAIFSGKTNDCNFFVETLRQMNLYAIISAKNPLSKKESLKISELKNQKIITKSKAFYLREVFENLCKANNFSPNIIFEISGPCMCNTLCEENKGVLIIDEAHALSTNSEKLIAVKIDDKNAKIPVSVVVNKENLRTAKIAHMLEHIRFWNETIDKNYKKVNNKMKQKVDLSNN